MGTVYIVRARMNDLIAQLDRNAIEGLSLVYKPLIESGEQSLWPYGVEHVATGRIGWLEEAGAASTFIHFWGSANYSQMLRALSRHGIDAQWVG